MTEITAQLVKELRDAPGGAMMECKKALAETGGDLEAAKDLLRKKGLSKASQKSDRATAEGMISIANNEKDLAMVELSSETDFVAKNEVFLILAQNLAKKALASKKNLQELLADSVEEEITEKIAFLGENIKLSKLEYLSLPGEGLVESYLHNSFPHSCGKIGVAVAISSDRPLPNKEKVANLAKQIGMHIAAMKPESLDISSLDPAKLEKEKTIVTEQARASGKPEAVIEKMIEGRIRKYYEEVVLLEQNFVINPDKKIAQVVKELGEELGCTLTLSGYLRLAVGG